MNSKLSVTIDLDFCSQLHDGGIGQPWDPSERRSLSGIALGSDWNVHDYAAIASQSSNINGLS
jgi:hypothetical protein